MEDVNDDRKAGKIENWNSGGETTICGHTLSQEGQKINIKIIDFKYYYTMYILIKLCCHFFSHQNLPWRVYFSFGMQFSAKMIFTIVVESITNTTCNENRIFL